LGYNPNVAFAIIMDKIDTIIRDYDWLIKRRAAKYGLEELIHWFRAIFYDEIGSVSSDDIEKRLQRYYKSENKS